METGGFIPKFEWGGMFEDIFRLGVGVAREEGYNTLNICLGLGAKGRPPLYGIMIRKRRKTGNESGY